MCQEDRRRHSHSRLLLLGAVAVLAAAALVMLLWNAVLSQPFSLPAMGYLQALGLLLLTRLLFGRGPRSWGPHAARHRPAATALQPSPEER